MTTEGRSKTSRRIVKHAAHGKLPLEVSRVVAWKKFCVVFSKACTEKFSQ